MKDHSERTPKKLNDFRRTRGPKHTRTAERYRAISETFETEIFADRRERVATSTVSRRMPAKTGFNSPKTPGARKRTIQAGPEREPRAWHRASGAAREAWLSAVNVWS